MTVPIYPGAEAPTPQRPGVVSLASSLIYAAAGISLLGSLLTVTTMSRTLDAYKVAYEDTGAAGTESVLAAVLVGALILNVLFAAGLAVLGIFDNRGRNGARITTWAVGGLVLCCGGIGLAGTAATSALDTGQTGGPSEAEVQQQLSNALPGWYEPTSTALSVLMLLALLAALILLALPKSNQFFQAVKLSRQGGWNPSVPYPLYPGQSYAPQPYQGQPYPGQPYPGQPYPGQPYPGQPGFGPEQQTPMPGQPMSTPPGPGGQEPSSGVQFGGDTTQGGHPQQQPPHTGSMPPTDPWGRPNDPTGNP